MVVALPPFWSLNVGSGELRSLFERELFERRLMEAQTGVGYRATDVLRFGWWGKRRKVCWSAEKLLLYYIWTILVQYRGLLKWWTIIPSISNRKLSPAIYQVLHIRFIQLVEFGSSANGLHRIRKSEDPMAQFKSCLNLGSLLQITRQGLPGVLFHLLEEYYAMWNMW